MRTTELQSFIPFEGQSFKDYGELVDHVEKVSMDNLPQMDLPLTHRFAPGQYSREMFAPAGTLITSKIHAEEHFFFITQGRILVIEEEGYTILSAPCHGISKSGARRIGLVIEDVIWTTVHSTSLVEDRNYTHEEMSELVKKIENQVIEPHTNKLLEV